MCKYKGSNILSSQNFDIHTINSRHKKLGSRTPVILTIGYLCISSSDFEKKMPRRCSRLRSTLYSVQSVFCSYVILNAYYSKCTNFALFTKPLPRKWTLLLKMILVENHPFTVLLYLLCLYIWITNFFCCAQKTILY